MAQTGFESMHAVIDNRSNPKWLKSKDPVVEVQKDILVNMDSTWVCWMAHLLRWSRNHTLISPSLETRGATLSHQLKATCIVHSSFKKKCYDRFRFSLSHILYQWHVDEIDMMFTLRRETATRRIEEFLNGQYVFNLLIK